MTLGSMVHEARTPESALSGRTAPAASVGRIIPNASVQIIAWTSVQRLREGRMAMAVRSADATRGTWGNPRLRKTTSTMVANKATLSEIGGYRRTPKRLVAPIVLWKSGTNPV